MGKDLNIPKVLPHKFRRTLATMAIDKGMPIEQVQHLLGHQSLDTTLQYAMVNQNNVKLSHHKFIGQYVAIYRDVGNPLSSIQKNELKKLGDCCQINPRRPSVSISDSDLVSFVPMPAVNEDGYIDGATNEEYGKVKKGFNYFENNDVLFAKITP